MIAVNFIAALLQVDPNVRLSMTESVNHPWLKAHTPFHPPDFDEVNGVLDNDMRMSVTSGFPEHDHNSLNTGPPHSSPTSALKRRKDVIAEADEGKVVLPEPSSEMFANITREGSSVATPSKGQNKRVHAELSVVPEDSLEHVYNAAAAAAAAAGAAGTAGGHQNAATLDAPPVVGSDSGENSDGRRRSARRPKVPRRD